MTARTLIAAVSGANVRSLPLASGGADMAPQTTDPSAFNESPMGGVPCLLVLENTDSSTRHVTVHSVADGYLNRTGDITSYPVPAQTTSIIPVPTKGFQQADGNLYFDCDNAALKAVLVQLPQGI